MKDCKNIRTLIDEADRPDVLPLEAADHVMSCVECHVFMDERAGLRTLLTAPKISVPLNFDAVLNERLRERIDRRGLAGLWRLPFVPGNVLLRAGAVAAILIAGVYVGQSVLFTRTATKAPGSREIAVVPAPHGSGQSTVSAPLPPAVESGISASISPAVRRQPRRGVLLAGDDARIDAALILVRGRNGDVEVPVPTVSVGAQSMYLVGNGGQQARGLRASF
jgi:hypothetical protein